MDYATYINLSFVFSCFPNVKPVYRHYERSLIAARRRKNSVIFLKNCIEEQVCPRYLGPTEHIALLRGEPFPKSVKYRIEDEIFRTQIDKENEFAKVRSFKREIQAVAPPHLHNVLFSHAKDIADFQSQKHVSGLKRKLGALCNNSIWEKMSNRESVKNISSYQLSKDETTFLGMGMSFSMDAQIPDILESTRKMLDLQEKYQKEHNYKKVKHTMFIMGSFIDSYLKIINQKFGDIPKRFYNAAKSLKRNKAIRITKADKGNSIVIIDQEQYINKVHNLLNDDQVYMKLRSNLKTSTATFKKNFCDRLRKIASLCPDPQFFKRFEPKYNVLPPLPHFYGLIKTHKQNSLRPIVAARDTVTHKLSQWLNSYLKPLVGTFSESHIINSQDFISKVRHIPTTNHKLVSFDVSALFTNVPLEDVLAFLQRKLTENNINLPVPVELFMELLRLCVCDNIFSFGEECFRQISGIAMGNCLSPVLANLYMEYFETELLPTILPKEIKCWLRYVDDIFCIWPAVLDSYFNTFFNKLNSLSPSISFTVEWENDKKNFPFWMSLYIILTVAFLSQSLRNLPTQATTFTIFLNTLTI